MYTSANPGSRKVLAVFMLLWAFADLGIPGWCQDDDGEVDNHHVVLTALDAAVHEHVSVCRNTPVAHPDMAFERSSDPEQQEPGPEDDCWCCCAHITPAGPISLAQLAVVSPAPVQLPSNLMEGTEPLLFHPPRS